MDNFGPQTHTDGHTDTLLIFIPIDLHLVSFLTINQQFGHEARENHNGQRQVMSVSGQAF